MLIHTPSGLAQLVRDQRKLHQQSQTMIAELAALRQDTVSRFEINPDNARLDTLFRLLAALELELHVVPRGGDDSDAVKPGADPSGWSEAW